MNGSSKMVRTAVAVGDRVRRRPVTVFGEEISRKQGPLTGRVTYVHPRGRYHLVDFGTFRESFPGVGR